MEWCATKIIYDPLWKNRYKSYEQVNCSGYFLCASNFVAWCKSQIGYNSVDDYGKPFALDKDILIKGNTRYSPDTCVFVPREINNLILSNRKVRGDLPIGYHTQNSPNDSLKSTHFVRTIYWLKTLFSQHLQLTNLPLEA